MLCYVHLHTQFSSLVSFPLAVSPCLCLSLFNPLPTSPSSLDHKAACVGSVACILAAIVCMCEVGEGLMLQLFVPQASTYGLD